jgi:beta-galactosidase
MKKFIFILFWYIIFGNIQAQNTEPQNILFDFDWRFHKGGADGAQAIEFDDSNWRQLDLPHDWSIEDLPGTNSPFNQDAISQVQGGFTTGGTGWYRKTFYTPETQKDKIFILQFEGVYMNSEIWINGKLVGKHPNGYTSFWFDITPFINVGSENILAVKVMNEGKNSRWYSGSGIYRHVWLSVLNPIHIQQWSTNITTPEINSSQATVNIQTKLINQSPASCNLNIVSKIVSPEEKEISVVEEQKNMNKDSISGINLNFLIDAPQLWSTETPNLYTAIIEVYNEGKLIDKIETKFGIRSISVDAKNGLLLNGKSVKLKGGCIHSDNGPLGAMSYDRAEERKIELLQASGFNAIRCSHNPPSPALLDACDRMGMLVIDEAFDTWKEPKNAFDYHLYFNDWWKKDIESMIFRDRNHPSIIIWSIGNEILNMQKKDVAATSKMLTDYIHKIEPTRPVTAAVNFVTAAFDQFIEPLDIAGYNYSRYGYVSDHERLPDRIMMSTESYPLEAFDYWQDVKDNPWLIGDFVWTAFDYLGEAGIGWVGFPQVRDNYPWTLAFTGDIDICGWKRPQSYYRDALWKTNQLSVFVTPPTTSFPLPLKKWEWSKWEWHDILADWTWPGFEKKPFQVTAYSSCDEVELFLNGESFGRKTTNQDTRFIATWEVPYEAGILKVIGYNGKKQVNAAELHSAREATQIKLSVDREQILADRQDLAYVTIEITDEKGILNPKADNLLRFEIDGPGTIVGVGNANPVSTESFQSDKRKAWKGKCLVIVKSTSNPGKIQLKVTSVGLKSNNIEIGTFK